MASSTRRAVITGVGIVNPIGLTPVTFWDSLTHGRSGVRPIESFDVSGLPIRFAGTIPSFDAKQFLDKKDRKSIKVMARSIQLAVAAAQLAVNDAAYDAKAIDPARFGVEFGAGLIATELDELASAANASTNCRPNLVDLDKWGEFGLPEMAPLWMLKYLPNMLACHVSIIHNAQGPNNTIIEDDVASLLALGEAYRILTRDQADLFLTGGADSKVNPLSFVRQCLIQSLSRENDNPSRACKPFDSRRDGSVLGEGGGVLVLEEREHALRRGARIYAELTGFGASFDKKRTGAGLARAIQAALNEAGIDANQIDHVNAHGVGSVREDAWEARGIDQIFHTIRPDVPVFAGKSYFGNLGAGSATSELIVSILAMNHGHLPPTLNFELPDPECPVAIVTGSGRAIERPYFLKLSLTPMGQCAAAVFRAHE